MKHDTARIATSEAVGSVTSLTGGLGGSAISMQQAEFGRANDPVIPKPDRDQNNSSSPVPGQSPGNGSLDDILGSIGKY